MVSESHDPYLKLRPTPPTPTDELCLCDDSPAIVLQSHLSPNPISCAHCNLEVPPEQIGFSVELAEALAHWREFHDAFYRLWLDSGEFEAWAADQLSDPQSTVNLRAFELVSKLNEHRRAYLWWFQDNTRDDFIPISNCPKCDAALKVFRGRLRCEVCSIIFAN